MLRHYSEFHDFVHLLTYIDITWWRYMASSILDIETLSSIVELKNILQMSAANLRKAVKDVIDIFTSEDIENT